MRHLESLPNRFNISIKPDKDGYLGRECPIKACKGYFKITPGTGLKGRVPCHCPYCGHSAKMSDFTTKAQIEYAKSVVIRQVTDAIHEDLKDMEFDHPPRGAFGIGISMKVTRDGPHPIRHYREKNSKPKWSATSAPCGLRSTEFSAGARIAAPITPSRS